MLTPQVRRRRTATVLVVGALVVGVARAGGFDGNDPGAGTTIADDATSAQVARPEATEAPAAPQQVAGPAAPTIPATTPLPDQSPAPAPSAGDLVISGISGLAASRSLLRRARAGEIAGVILMGHNISTVDQVKRLTGSLQRAARRGGQLPLLVMVDQEGGKVKRFKSARPSRSARSIASLPLAAVEAQGLGTGTDLKARGVNVNLAPVVDVPTAAGNFLQTRAFGTTGSAVARNACRFAAGQDAAGVIGTLKHFPGLGGGGSTNTDFGRVAITLSREDLEEAWEPYRVCGAGQPGRLIMVSNASYPALTGSVPALLSKSTYAAARSIGADGPFITDAMEARALAGLSNVPSRSVAAGANLVLYTGEAGSKAGWRDIAARVPSTVVAQRASEVQALRAALGAAAG